jgi:hypothetical protein
MEEQDQLSPDQIMDGFLGEGDGLAHSFEDFPPEVRDDVEGLMWLGYLEDEFTFCGHHFVIRTLRGDEELLATLVTKEFVETLGQAKAYVWAQIALALSAVDGDSDFCPPVSNNKREYARARFQYCTGKWFWPLATFIYGKYTALLERQTEALARVEDLSNGSQLMSTPFAGSSTESGDSEEQQEPDTPPQEDIREYLDPQDSADSNSD